MRKIWERRRWGKIINRSLSLSSAPVRFSHHFLLHDCTAILELGPDYAIGRGKANPKQITHVRYIKILTWLRGFRDKIANFSRPHCLIIPRRDLITKKTKPNTKKLPESLGVVLEFKYNFRTWLFANLGLHGRPGGDVCQVHCRTVLGDEFST